MFNLKIAPKYPPREPRRLSCATASLLLPDDRELPIELGNVSAKGFMARSQVPIPANISLGLNIPGFGIIRAEVRWSEGYELGGSFEEDLPEQLLTRL